VIAVGSHALAVDILGQGPPALFIHGFGADKYTWRYLAAELSSSFTCYTIDLPGIGESKAPDDFDYSLEAISDVVSCFCEEMGLNDLTLFCHSLGAAVGCLALIRNERFAATIQRLCILDGVCYPQRFPFFIALLRIPVVSKALISLIPRSWQAYMVLRYCHFDGSKISADQMGHYAGLIETAEKREALRAIAVGIDRRHLSAYSARLHELKFPTLLIWGLRDRVVPLALGKRLQADLNSSLYVVNECGHIPHEECADVTIARVKDWIASGQ